MNHREGFLALIALLEGFIAEKENEIADGPELIRDYLQGKLDAYCLARDDARRRLEIADIFTA